MLNSFNTGEEGNYSVDKVLKSLGELEKTVESKKNSNSEISLWNLWIGRINEWRPAPNTK